MRWDETYRAQRCLVDHRYSVNMNSILPLLLSTCWSFSCSTKKMEQRRWRKQRLLNRARATVKVGLLLVFACSCAFRCSENRFQDHLTATAASSESHLQTRHRLLHARCLTQLREIQTIKEQNGVAIRAKSLRGELRGGDPQLWRISPAGCAHRGESHHNHEPGTRYAYSHSASLFSQVSIYPRENQHRQLTGVLSDTAPTLASEDPPDSAAAYFPDFVPHITARAAPDPREQAVVANAHQLALCLGHSWPAPSLPSPPSRWCFLLTSGAAT